jgi:hypothetical protein
MIPHFILQRRIDTVQPSMLSALLFSNIDPGILACQYYAFMG